MGPVMNGAVRCTNQCHCLKMNRIRKYIIQVAQAHEAHLDIGVPAGLNTDAAAVGGSRPRRGGRPRLLSTASPALPRSALRSRLPRTLLVSAWRQAWSGDNNTSAISCQ